MEQYNIFDYMDSKNNLRVNPVEKEKSTDSIVNKIFIEDILRGTGFENGKKHIYELYQSDMSANDRAKAIKDYYDIGGHSLHGQYFRRGFQNHDAKGIEIEFDNVKYMFSWGNVEKTIHSLIDSGQYYQQKVIGYCHATLEPCNRENLTPVAREIGMKCLSPCCAGCSERKECGAACNYSRRY